MKRSKPKKAKSSKDLDSLVEKEMPGWQIVRTKAKPMRKVSISSSAADTPSKAAPSIKDLKRKFLRKSSDTDSDETIEFKSLDKSVKTVRVAPKTGGAPLTADIKGGKIKIVQG